MASVGDLMAEGNNVEKTTEDRNSGTEPLSILPIATLTVGINQGVWSSALPRAGPPVTHSPVLDPALTHSGQISSMQTLQDALRASLSHHAGHAVLVVIIPPCN